MKFQLLVTVSTVHGLNQVVIPFDLREQADEVYTKLYQSNICPNYVTRTVEKLYT